MSATYFGILTKYGEEREAQAHALGVPLKITSLAVGDGGGIVPTPDRLQTAVIGEWRRKPLNQLSTDPENPSWLIAEQVIPENEGGNWIRTLGLHDETGGLVAVANCPPTYKPLLAEGSGRTQVIRMVLMVSSAANFELKIDPAVVLATRKYVDDGLLTKLDKNGTAVAAAKLATARTIALTGDGTASVSFDGSKNVSAALALAASGVTAGTAGTANEIPVITVDAKGRVITLGKVAVGNAATATKLAAARLFSITGGATAGGVSFDGAGNVALNVTALDVSKATAGTLPVARGGTGATSFATGSYLTGAGAGALVPRTPAEVLDDIQALPKAGGNVSGPIVLGAGATVGSQYGSNATPGQTAQIILPDGGGFSTHTATVVGAMKITLPPAAVGSNTIIRLRVDVFEHAADLPPMSILIQGYVQTSKVWVRCGATILAGVPNSDLPVRFGSDASGNLCIWLGDTNRSWSYPTVSVSEVLAKYNTAGATVAAWGVGWKVEPVTAFETVSLVVPVSNLAFGRSDIPNVAGLQDALAQKANAAVTLTAGNGLSGGGNLGANRSFALGTPGTITKATTNAVQGTSHTHALDVSASDIGAASADTTLTAGNGLSGGGSLAANRAFTLGTPGTISKASTNAVQATSHTHALDISASDIGAASADLTLTAGNGLSGGGNLGANRTFALGTPGKLTAASTNAVTATSHTHELDTQTSQMDATSGRLLLVGAFGLGAYNPLDTADLDNVVIPGDYGQNANANATIERHYPVAGAAGTLKVGVAGTYIVTHTFVTFSPVRVFVRSRTSPILWSGWDEVVTTANNPVNAWAGMIAFFGRNSAPAGWLKANGATVSRTTYADLFAAIGTTWGAGNGTTTFVLPDLRAEFPRGWDDGRGQDPGRAFGSAQADALQLFSGTFALRKTVDGLSLVGNSGVTGAFSFGQGSGSSPRLATAVTQDLLSDDRVTFSPATAGARTASETRSRNIALLACIKF